MNIKQYQGEVAVLDHFHCLDAAFSLNHQTFDIPQHVIEQGEIGLRIVDYEYFMQLLIHKRPYAVSGAETVIFFNRTPTRQRLCLEDKIKTIQIHAQIEILLRTIGPGFIEKLPGTVYTGQKRLERLDTIGIILQFILDEHGAHHIFLRPHVAVGPPWPPG